MREPSKLWWCDYHYRAAAEKIKMGDKTLSCLNARLGQSVLITEMLSGISPR